MHFDFTITLTTVLQLPVLAGVWYVVRFVSIQRDFPPHRHTNGDIFYPKGFAPERAQHIKGGL